MNEKKKEIEESSLKIQHLQLTIRDLEIKLENAKAREELSQRATEAAERKLKERLMKSGQQDLVVSIVSNDDMWAVHNTPADRHFLGTNRCYMIPSLLSR